MARRPRRRTIVLLALAALLAWDLTRRPDRQLTGRTLVAGIHLYQGTLSSWMSRAGVVCRFEPSCSRYAEVSIRRHGAVLGGVRSLARLVRCGPWTPANTVDPPPDAAMARR